MFVFVLFFVYYEDVDFERLVFENNVVMKCKCVEKFLVIDLNSNLGLEKV